MTFFPRYASRHFRGASKLDCATLLALGLLATQAQAQQVADVCLKGGTTVHVTKIEPGASGYVLTLVGGVTMTVAPDAIQAMGQTCAPSPASGRFGIAGSNTIGERLMPMLIDGYAMAKLGKPAKFIPVAPEEQTIELRAPGGGDPLATIDFKAHGSGTAFPALLDSKIEIGMSSRRIKDNEAADFTAKFNVDMQTSANEHVLGLDGLAVIVNARNPVKNLTLEQLAKIFSGQIHNWLDVTGTDDSGRSVHGEDLAIAVNARDDKSGTYDTFKTLVLGVTTPPSALIPTAQRFGSSEDLTAAVAKDTGAIGFIGLPYVEGNHAVGIAGACGLISLPTKFGVKTEQYSLTRRLFLYSVGDPANPTANALLKYALSDEAQAVVRQAEFVDQSIEFVSDSEQRAWTRGLVENPNGYLPQGQQPVPSATLHAFNDVSRKLRRSSVVFRFETGKSDLDVLAIQNIFRLKSFLSGSSVPLSAVWIVGFADAQGDWTSNYKLSADRARAVIDKLGAAGVKIPQSHTLPLSYMAPVACNDGEAGRAKNRRVEVWIAP